MKFQSFLDNLRNLHPANKNRILAAVVVVSFIGIGALWAHGVQQNLTGLDKSSVLPDTGKVLSANSDYISVESFEQKGDQKYVYFKVQNNTSDILNFVTTDKIHFTAGSRSFIPASVTDRQGMPFVTKILSNTTAYGILVFNKFDDDSGNLIFDDLYFETTPEALLEENIKVDFKSLKPLEELRS